MRIRTEKDKKEAEITVQRMVSGRLIGIGINLLPQYVEILECEIGTDLVGKDQSPEEQNSSASYKFVQWHFLGQPGPWHMLIGETESGGTVCRTTRDFSKIKGRESSETYPEGKNCSTCHKQWAKLEREKKAAEKAARKAARETRREEKKTKRKKAA